MSDDAALLDAIRQIVRSEIAAAFKSGTASAPGIGTGGERPPWHEQQDHESMDHTNTESDGESRSLRDAEEEGRRAIRALRRGRTPTLSSLERVTRRKASRSSTR